jgi:hypothetical protein
VKFYTPRAVSTRVNLTYVTPNAGWAPGYDLRVEKINTPVRLFYKAQVFQNSGVKWDKVRLTLSTGNPQEGAEAPVYSAQYLGAHETVVSREVRRYVAPLIDPAEPGGRSVKTAEQIEKAATRNSLDIASLSTQTYEGRRGSGIAIGGSRISGTKIIIDGVQQNPGSAAFIDQAPNTSLNTYTFANGGGINTTFDIELPYDIPSDGQQHTVAVKTYDLPATYRYYASPRQDKDVFLQAQITDWEDLNLIPAPTSVFFEGYYVGQGRIDMNNVKDTLNLSLGRDKKIVVNRERDRNFRSEKVIGTNIRQEYAWSITVRNTRSERINLQIVDQIPVSGRSDILIEDVKTPSATTDELSGRVEWNLELKPAETKKLQTRFVVKYPKHVSIAGL